MSGATRVDAPTARGEAERRRHLAALVLILAACSRPEDRATPEPPAAGSDRAPRSKPGDAPTPAPKADKPAPRPVVLVDGSLEAPLFSEERAKVRAAAIHALEANTSLPVQVVPEARVAALRALAKEGKLREGGKRCAAAPSEAEVLRAALPKSLAGSFSLLCSGARCNAQLVVTGVAATGYAFSNGPRLLESFASPTDPTSVTSWERAFTSQDGAVRAGAPPQSGGGGVGMLVGGGGRGDTFDLLGVSGYGFAQAPTLQDLEPHVDEAKACKASEGGMLVLAVDEKGAVSRCEGPSPCLCRAFSRKRFPEGKGARRLTLDVVAGRAMGRGLGGLGGLGGYGDPSKRVMVFELRGQGVPYDEPFERRRARRTALEACFADQKTQLDFSVDSTLDEVGHVTRARVTEGDLTEAQRACVEKVAKGSSYRCPDAAGDTISVGYGVRPPP